MLGTRIIARSLSAAKRPQRSPLQLRSFSSSSSSSSSAKPTFRERWGKLRSNGTPEIVFGVSLLGLLLIDQLLRDKQLDERQEAARRIQEVIAADEARLENELAEERKDILDRPALFRCIVRQVPPAMFDGQRCLTGVENGDVVDVIEESVGPNGSYNLCRYCGENEEQSNASVGWFPTSCLEKVGKKVSA